MLASAGHFLKKEIKAVSKSLVCTPALLLKKFKFQVRNSVHVHSTVLVLCSIMGYSLCRIWCWILWNSPEFEDPPSPQEISDLMNPIRSWWSPISAGIGSSDNWNEPSRVFTAACRVLSILRECWWTEGIFDIYSSGVLRKYLIVRC